MPPRKIENLTTNEQFCRLLRNNKVKDSREFWNNLNDEVKEMLLYYSFEILQYPSQVSDDSYKTAFYLFKLFHGKEMKDDPFYVRYLPKSEPFYKQAKVYFSKPKEVFEKECQKKACADGPLKIYYQTLYEENPESTIAIMWLVENGLGDDLIEEYKKLKGR